MADTTDGERIAEERIEEAARTGQDWLDLAGLGLDRLPHNIDKAINLQRLSIGGSFHVTANGGLSESTRKGSSQIADLHKVSKLINLRELFIEGTACTELASLSPLKELRRLNCSDTKIRDLSPLKNFSHLGHLDCSNTDIRDLTPLMGLRQLRHLDFKKTDVRDLSPLARLDRLQLLDCTSTQVNDLHPLIKLSKLQLLSFMDTRIREIKSLSALKNLTYINMSVTKIHDLSPLADLAQLSMLLLWKTRVKDLTPIRHLENLLHLDIDETHVSDLAPLASLRELRGLSARNCQIDSLPPDLGQLRALQLFDLRNNKLRKLPNELGSLVSLGKAAQDSPDHSGLRLEGNPLTPPLLNLIAPGQPQATINVLRWLRNEPISTEAKDAEPPSGEEVTDDPPTIPEQGAGPRVILDQTGRLVFAKPADLDTKGNDRNRLEALHPALREAAADLAKALQDQSSNIRNERLLQKAEAYRALVDVPLEDVDFARLYGAGMQLLNATGATRKALDAGRVDVPDLSPIQDECLANIENLHPPFVLASRDGAEMLADQTTIKLTADHVEVIKEAGEALGEALLQRPDLAAPEIGKTMRDAAAEIGQGENAARDAVNAVSSTRNTVIVAVWVATAVSLPTIGSGFAGVPGAVSGGLLGYFLGESVKASGHFKNMAKRGGKLIDASAEIDFRARVEEWRKLLIQNSRYLQNMMHVPKFEWLKPVIDRLKRNSPPDKKE